MRKRSTSSQGSDKSQEAPIKRDKKLVTFEYHQLDCFMSASSQKFQQSSTNTHNKRISHQQPDQTNIKKEKVEEKNSFSQLRVPRRNRGKIASNSQQAFNNFILLLEY
jgi:CRISPR/Cas system-associated protein endoribonuclease Cas2